MDKKNKWGLDVRIIDEADITDELDYAIRQGLIKCFPKDADHFSQIRWWHSRPAWTVYALHQSETVAAHLAVVERQVLVGAEAVPIAVAGVQGFFVQSQWRKSGLSDYIMSAAVNEAYKRRSDSGLLHCVPYLEKLYARMGWNKIDVELFMYDTSGKRVRLSAKSISMMIPIRMNEFPAGDINLMGYDW